MIPLWGSISRARWLELAGAVAFALFAGWRLLDPRRLVAAFDTVAFTVPNQDFAFATLRDLRLPGWNDLVFGGTPGFANPQLGALYPLKWPFLWVETHRGVLILAAAHLVLLAIGAVVLLGGRLGLRPPAAFLGAVALTGCGYATARTLHVEQLLTLAWGPWLLAAVDAVVVGAVRPRRGAVLVALPLALALLAGQQQPVYYLFGVATLWAVGRALDARRFRGLLVAAGGAVLGVGLAAIQLVPSALLADRSSRSGGLPLATLDDVPGWVLRTRQVVRVVLGDAFEASSDAVSNGLEAMSYVGAVVLALALVGLAAGVLDPRQRFAAISLLLVCLSAIALAAGPRSPLFRAAYEVLPAFNLFRVPARSLLALDVALALLAALGVDAIVSRRVGRRVLAAAGATAGFAIVLAGAGAFARPSGPVFAVWIAATLLVGAAAAAPLRRPAFAALGAVLVAAVLELGTLGVHFPLDAQTVEEPATEPVGPAARFLAGRPERAMSIGQELLGDPSYLARSLRSNTNGPVGVRTLDGYDGGPAVTRRWVEAMESLARPPFSLDLLMRAHLADPLSPELFALFGVRYVLVDTIQWPPPQWLSGWRGPVVSDGTLEVWENPAYEGEAFLYGATRFLAAESGPALAALGEDVRLVALVEEDGPRLGCGGCARAPVLLERLAAGRLAATTESARPSLLVVAEQWDPGWRAQVDRESAEPVPVNGFQLGVPVPAGSHRVSFVYEIDGLGLGVPLTLAALSVVCVLLLPLPGRRRSSPR